MSISLAPIPILADPLPMLGRFDAVARFGQILPVEVRQLLLVLLASFLIGLVMETRKQAGTQEVSPGGVRTFPLISLAGFLLPMLSPQPWAMAAFIGGLLVLGGWLTLMYRAKIQRGKFGMTTESTVVATYILGGLVWAQLWWLTCALTVILVILQELKAPLERLASRLPEDELVTIAKFILLSAVILPVVSDQPVQWFFGLVPQKIWLIVVAVAGISYASYVLGRLTRGKSHSLLLAGLLGGGYSSTVTTVVLARQSRAGATAGRPALAYAASILSASGVMYLRLLVLVGLFNVALMKLLLWPFAISAGVGIVLAAVLVLAARGGEGSGQVQAAHAASPLELRTAFAFGVVFIGVLLLTRGAQALGGQGLYLYGLGAVSGLGVVDPFVLGLTQSPELAAKSAGLAVVIAAVANNLAKGLYASVLAERRTGRLALVLLASLGAVTVAAWCVMLRAGWLG